jgi:anti-sigma factor RsiW
VSDENRFCSDEKLLLAFHGALPALSWLRVQLHCVTCSACRRRYRELGQTSLALREIFSGQVAAPRPPGTARLAPALVALACLFALSALAWSARAYLAPFPDTRLTDRALLEENKRCEPLSKEP